MPVNMGIVHVSVVRAHSDVVMSVRDFAVVSRHGSYQGSGRDATAAKGRKRSTAQCERLHTETVALRTLLIGRDL